MCTATWVWQEGGYDFLFNRDERRQRGRAELPTVREEEGIAFLAPRDRDAGGTWLAANELGLSVGLLNFYDAPAVVDPSREEVSSGAPFVSRGLLVTSLASADRVEEVARRLEAVDLPRYRPFTLLAIEAPAGDGNEGEAVRGEVAVFQWDGSSLVRLPEPSPRLLSSSGYDAPRALQLRSEVLAAVEASSASALRLFHCSHQPERGAYSPCMHRDDASTVSFSAIRVGTEEVRFEYSDGPPCVTEVGEPLRLSRRLRRRAAALG